MNDLAYKRRKEEKSIPAKEFTTLNKSHDSAHKLDRTRVARQAQVHGWGRTRAAVTNQPDMAWVRVQRQKGEKGNIVGNHSLQKKEIRDAKVKFDRKR